MRNFPPSLDLAAGTGLAWRSNSETSSFSFAATSPMGFDGLLDTDRGQYLIVPPSDRFKPLHTHIMSLSVPTLHFILPIAKCLWVKKKTSITARLHTSSDVRFDDRCGTRVCDERCTACKRKPPRSALGIVVVARVFDEAASPKSNRRDPNLHIRLMRCDETPHSSSSGAIISTATDTARDRV